MFKSIKICLANKGAIESALHAVNGRSTAHAYSTFADIDNEAKYADKSIFELIGNKSEMVGAVLFSVSGKSVANSYNSRSATSVSLIYKSSGWHLNSAASVTIYKDGGKRSILLTQKQADKAAAAYAKQWIVVQAAPGAN